MHKKKLLERYGNRPNYFQRDAKEPLNTAKASRIEPPPLQNIPVKNMGVGDYMSRNMIATDVARSPENRSANILKPRRPKTSLKTFRNAATFSNTQAVNVRPGISHTNPGSLERSTDNRG